MEYFVCCRYGMYVAKPIVNRSPPRSELMPMKAPGPMGHWKGCWKSLAVAEPGMNVPPAGAPVIWLIGARVTEVVERRIEPANSTCVPRATPMAAGFQ